MSPLKDCTRCSVLVLYIVYIALIQAVAGSLQTVCILHSLALPIVKIHSSAPIIVSCAVQASSKRWRIILFLQRPQFRIVDGLPTPMSHIRYATIIPENRSLTLCGYYAAKVCRRLTNELLPGDLSSRGGFQKSLRTSGSVRRGHCQWEGG